MTTTAFDDQFVINTETHITMYSIEEILRRNVADLEIVLRTQIERAEAAEAELLAVREDNHAMMLEIHGLRKDAERYRWLRDAGATFYTGGPEITDGSDKVHVCEFAMDAAIDAARRHCAILPCSCK